MNTSTCMASAVVLEFKRIHFSQISSRFLSSTPSNHLNGAITKERHQAAATVRRLSMAGPLMKPSVPSAQPTYTSNIILRSHSMSDGGNLAAVSQSKPRAVHGAVNEGEERRMALERFKEEKAMRRASMAGPPLPPGASRRDSLAGGAFPPPPPILGTTSRRESTSGPPLPPSLPPSRRESVSGPPPSQRTIPPPPKFDEVTRPSFPSQHSLLSTHKSPIKQQSASVLNSHSSTAADNSSSAIQIPSDPADQTAPAPAPHAPAVKDPSMQPSSLKSDLKSLRIQELQLRFINAKMKQGLTTRTHKSERTLAACALTLSRLEERVSLASQLKQQELLVHHAKSLALDLAPLLARWSLMSSRHSASIGRISSALIDSMTSVPLINGAVMSSDQSRERFESSMSRIVDLIGSMDECTCALVPRDHKDQDQQHLVTSELAQGLVSTLVSEAKALGQLLDLVGQLKDVGDQAASLEAQACL